MFSSLIFREYIEIERVPMRPCIKYQWMIFSQRNSLIHNHTKKNKYHFNDVPEFKSLQSKNGGILYFISYPWWEAGSVHQFKPDVKKAFVLHSLVTEKKWNNQNNCLFRISK